MAREAKRGVRRAGYIVHNLDRAKMLNHVDRAVASISGRLRSARAHPLLHRDAMVELLAERSAGYPAEEQHRPHLDEAVAWLERAQDAHDDDGFARGYSLVRDPYFGWHGWQPSYPETTGYIIPTFYTAAGRLGRPDLAARATRAAEWEIEVQLPSGAARGGVITQQPAPAVFNTGQVLLGWVAAARCTGQSRFADAAYRAGSYLVAALGSDELWLTGRSIFAHGGLELYNARTAWALAETGLLLEEPGFTAAAQRVLHAVARRQHANGWFPDCCLTDPARPLLHTLSYATRGLLEGGRILGEQSLIDGAARAAAALAETVDGNGRMPGRYGSDWGAGASWSCLTGQAQAATNWLRLHAITGERHWLEPVPAVLQFLKTTQNRTTRVPGIRGGIKGSSPISGAYGRFEILNWATKFFIDSLLRHERTLAGVPSDVGDSALA